jgi:hypothetical protein
VADSIVQQIKASIASQEDVNANVISLFAIDQTQSFRDKLLKIFTSLSPKEAKSLYELLKAAPEVKDIWIEALELRIESQSSDIENVTGQVQSLDKELNDILEKYTELFNGQRDFKFAMEQIQKIQLDLELEKDELGTEIESDLFDKLQLIFLLIQACQKK